MKPWKDKQFWKKVGIVFAIALVPILAHLFFLEDGMTLDEFIVVAIPLFLLETCLLYTFITLSRWKEKTFLKKIIVSSITSAAIIFLVFSIWIVIFYSCLFNKDSCAHQFTAAFHNFSENV